MTAYIAINGNDATGKLYETRLTREELAEGVLAYQNFDAAQRALAACPRNVPIGIINLGYLQVRKKVEEPAPAAAAEESAAEAAPTNPEAENETPTP